MEPIQRATEAIQLADALLITAGAGMGVDSGLPDFRGTEGFWNAYPAYRDLGLRFSELANPQWFERDPALAWGFYGHRLGLYRAATPHAGFSILKKWAGRMPGGARVFTSNVDGQFQKSGFPDECITEVHGSIHYLQCSAGCDGIWSADAISIHVDEATFRATGEFPKCPQCHEIARPNILMFGDDGWLGRRSDAQQKKLEAWLRGVKNQRLVVVECGAGNAVPTVRLFSEQAAVRDGAKLIRINVREPETRPRDIGISMGALEALQAIDQKLGEWAKDR